MTQPYDVFLSFTWSDITEVLRLERALKAAGLRVFRDSEEIRPFDGITEGLDAALATSKVLLAFYSRRFPTRYACQWELTSAFIAAQALGDPRLRVLVVNPEHDGDHIAPVELQDAAYVSAPHDDRERTRIAERVAEVVHAAGTPLGAARSTAPLLPRLLRPRRFVGRYRQLWAIHTALHTRELPPLPCPVRRRRSPSSAGSPGSGRPAWPSSTRSSSATPSPVACGGSACSATTTRRARSGSSTRRSAGSPPNWVPTSPTCRRTRSAPWSPGAS